MEEPIAAYNPLFLDWEAGVLFSFFCNRILLVGEDLAAEAKFSLLQKQATIPSSRVKNKKLIGRSPCRSHIKSKKDVPVSRVLTLRPVDDRCITKCEGWVFAFPRQQIIQSCGIREGRVFANRGVHTLFAII